MDNISYSVALISPDFKNICKHITTVIQIFLAFVKFLMLTLKISEKIDVHYFSISGPGGSSGKALGCGLDGPGSILGVGGVEIFLHTFVSRLALGSTQPPIK